MSKDNAIKVDEHSSMLYIMNYSEFVEKLFKRFPEFHEMDGHTLNMLHAALGIAGEAGEVVDMIKKNFASNKGLDIDELDKEIGDLLFYVQALINVTGGNMHDIMEKNIAKLTTRYGGTTYSDEAAREQRDKYE